MFDGTQIQHLYQTSQEKASDGGLGRKEIVRDVSKRLGIDFTSLPTPRKQPLFSEALLLFYSPPTTLIFLLFPFFSFFLLFFFFRLKFQPKDFFLSFSSLSDGNTEKWEVSTLEIMFVKNDILILLFFIQISWYLLRFGSVSSFLSPGKEKFEGSIINKIFFSLFVPGFRCWIYIRCNS